MDIALEFCDTFFFDHVFAKVFPASPPPYSLDGASNSTIAGLKAASPWQYKPATSFLSFTPRDAAYMSELNRDNIYRQAFSLFLIMWYVFQSICKYSANFPGLPVVLFTSSSRPSPTSSSSTRQPSNTQSSSRTRSARKSDKPAMPCPSCPSSLCPYSSPKYEATRNSTTAWTTSHSNTTTTYNFPSSSSSRTCSSTSSTAAYTTHSSTRRFTSPTTNGSCPLHTQQSHSTLLTAGRSPYPTTSSHSSSHSRRSLTSHSSSSSRSGPSSSTMANT